jgi:F-type H+-transporting ATPase subunit c
MDIGAAKLIAAGIAVLPLFGVGLGLGRLFSSLIESIGRNPSAKGDLMTSGTLCFTFLESVALLAFVVAMLILFVV